MSTKHFIAVECRMCASWIVAWGMCKSLRCVNVNTNTDSKSHRSHNKPLKGGTNRPRDLGLDELSHPLRRDFPTHII